MSQLNSTLTPKEQGQQIPTPTPYPPQLSSLTIGIIVISVVAGVGLLGLSFLLVRWRQQQSKQRNALDIESSPQLDTNANKKGRKKRVFSLSSEDKNNTPVQTSSLDNNNDLFNTILEYPAPIKPSPSAAAAAQQLLQVPSTVSGTAKGKNDAISASLARQNVEERSGYYKSPTRTPIPYYQHRKHQSCSIPSSSSDSSSSAAADKKFLNNEDDEDEKVMQRWSASSYHVW